MKTIGKVVLAAGLGLAFLSLGGGAASAKCMKAGGVGMGITQGIATFMAEAAMKNQAKARLGDAVKIGKVSHACGWKTLAFECTARAQTCT